MTFRVLFYLSLLVITTVTALINYRKLSTAYKYLCYLLVVTLGLEVGAKVLELNTGSSFSIYHYTIVCGLILNFFIYVNLMVVKKHQFVLMLGVTVVFVFLSIVNSLYVQLGNTFPSNGVMMYCFQIILFVMLSYLNMLKFPVKTSIYKQPVFWLNAGNLVFYGLTFTIFSVYNFFYKSANGSSIGFNLIYVANILLYSSYLVVIFLDSKKSNE